VAIPSPWRGQQVPAQNVSGHHWITILTAMFMHRSWSHIVGNMIFLWAFGPEIVDAMGRGQYLIFYLLGGLMAMLDQVAASWHSPVSNLGPGEHVNQVLLRIRANFEAHQSCSREASANVPRS